MTAEEMKSLARYFFETDGQEVLAKAGELMDSEFVYHISDGDTDLEGWIQENAAFMAAFPDLAFSLDNLIVEGDMAVEMWTMTGTHQAELNGIPATNKTVKQKGVSVDRMRNGKIVETWTFSDSMSLLQQLGVSA